MRRKGFTLLELSVAIVIVLVLAAILLPVFTAARSKAQQTAWVESMRQVHVGSTLYMMDYDDRYMVARYSVSEDAEPQDDRTWVQTMLPYVREFDLFLCPVDGTRDPSLGVFDADIVPGDSYARFYSASKRSNIGYNFMYLAPIVNIGVWQSRPRQASEVSDPTRTIAFGESTWEVVNGKPSGGGHFLVVPPCRYRAGFGRPDSFELGGIDVTNIYTTDNGWVPEDQLEQYQQAGGLYPWFGERVNVMFAAGQVRRLTLPGLAAGCEVTPDWSGLITDPNAYLWDIR